MKPSFNRFLAASIISVLALSSSAFAVDRIKQDNTDDLNLGTSWDTLPGASDVGVWNSTVTSANTVNLGTDLSWSGLRLDDPAGDVVLTGSNNLTLGTDGLDTGSTANLTWNSSGNISLGTLAGSTTLTYDANNTTNWTGLTTINFTGTLVLRGGSGVDGAFSGEWFAFGKETSLTQTGSFHLDTGASLADRRDVILTGGDTGGGSSVLSLDSLTGYGDFRSDWTGSLGTRTISVNQSTDTEFQGRIDQNNASTGAAGRSITLAKSGGGKLTLTGENVDHATVVTGGTLAVGNGGTTGNIGVGTVSVGSGATLEFNRTDLLDYKASARMRNVSGAGDIVLDGGVKLFNYTGGGLGFDSAGTWNLFTGDLIIKGGSEFQTIRNGATAMGTGNIVLGDGSSSGTLSQIEGNWTWTNDIQLIGSANEILNNATGSGRANKLQGVISGAGGLTFSDPAGGMSSGDGGFILTGTNTMSSTLTVDTFVRVGGATGDDSSTAGGTGGTLGTASVVINSGKRLTFSRSDSHTVANTISGDGAVHVGSPGIAGTDTQMLTLSGSNTYTGDTSVNTGQLNLAGSLTSAVNVESAAGISGSGSTSGLLTMANGSKMVLAGDSTTSSFTVNGATFNGPTTVTFGTAPIPSTVYDVFTYGGGTVTDAFDLTVAWRGSLSDDVGNQKYIFTAGAAGTRTWATTDGGWEQGVDTNFAEGDTLFYGGDTVFFNEPAADSLVDLFGVLVPAAVTVTNTTNPYTFDGPGSLSGTMTLTKSGAGTLTISNDNTYTGGTILSGGQLNINGPSAIGATASALTISGPSTLDNTSGSAITLGTNNPQNWNADFTFTGTNDLNLGTGAVTLNGDRQVTVSAGVLTAGGTVSGAFTLTKAGAGTLTLGANNATATIINGGTLKVAGNSNIGTSSIAIASGTVFEWAPTANNVTFAGSLSGTGKVLRSDSAAANAVFSGDNSAFNGTWEIAGDYAGLATDSSVGAPAVGMTLNGGGIYFTSTGQTLAATRTITLGASGGYLNGSTGNINTFAAKFTGAGNLIKVSGERAILTNPANDFTGNIDITGGGILEIGDAGQFAAGSYSGNIAVGAGSDTFAVNSTANHTLSGLISGAGRLSKGNSGTLTLTSSASHTGTTTVSSGTLIVETGGSISGSSLVTVEAAGTLGGLGTITAPVTAAGTIAPGTSVGTLPVVGNTAITGTLAIEVDGAAGDKLSVAGDLDLTGSSVTVSEIGSGFTEASYVIAECSGALTGLPTAPFGYAVSAAGSQVVLTEASATPYEMWLALYSFDGGDDTTPTGDPDGDGLSNQEEFAFGLDPTSGASVAPISEQLDKTTGIFKYTRFANSGLTYKIETSTTLSSWALDAGATASQVGGAVDGLGNQEVTVTITGAPLADPKFFVRVTAD